MAIKQMKITLQAQPQGGADVNLTVSVDGIQRFNEAVPTSGPIVLHDPNPNESVQFDIDVPVLNQGDADPTVTLPLAISCTNGSIKIDYISNNFALRSYTDEAGNVVLINGAANSWVDNCEVTSQPMWNGTALLQRYDISYNRGPEQVTGPGEILINAGETVTFDIAINRYNDSIPLPPA